MARLNERVLNEVRTRCRRFYPGINDNWQSGVEFATLHGERGGKNFPESKTLGFRRKECVSGYFSDFSGIGTVSHSINYPFGPFQSRNLCKKWTDGRRIFRGIIGFSQPQDWYLFRPGKRRGGKKSVQRNKLSKRERMFY